MSVEWKWKWKDKFVKFVPNLMDREQQCMKLKSKVTTSLGNNNKQQKLLIRQNQHVFWMQVILLYIYYMETTQTAIIQIIRLTGYWHTILGNGSHIAFN